MSSAGSASAPKIDRFLRLMTSRGASDFHMTVGRPPMLRVSGSMEPIRYRTLSEADFTELMRPILPERLWEGSSRPATSARVRDRRGRALRSTCSASSAGSGDLPRDPQDHDVEQPGCRIRSASWPRWKRPGAGDRAWLGQVDDARRGHQPDQGPELPSSRSRTRSSSCPNKVPDPPARIGARDLVLGGAQVGDREDPDLILWARARPRDDQMALPRPRKGTIVFGTLHATTPPRPATASSVFRRASRKDPRRARRPLRAVVAQLVEARASWRDRILFSCRRSAT